MANAVTEWVQAQRVMSRERVLDREPIRMSLRMDPTDVYRIDRLAGVLGLSMTATATKLLSRAVDDAWASVYGEEVPGLGPDGDQVGIRVPEPLPGEVESWLRTRKETD